MARKDLYTAPFEVGYASENVAASDTAEPIVAASPGKKIRVLALAFVCGDTGTDATLNSASSAISPLFANGANGGAVLPFNPLGWFETNAGEALTVTTGAGSSVGVLVVYALVP